MSRLNIKSFISFSGDIESDQYRILAGIKEYSWNFRMKKLYPALSDLIDLLNTLNGLLKMKNGLANSFPKHVAGFDVENQKIILEDSEIFDQNLESLFELLEWAIPVIRQTIEEGTSLYEYVEKNIDIDEIGIVPLYRDEGYMILPDNLTKKYLIHRFRLTLFSGGEERFRILRTKFLEAVHKAFENTPEHLKKKLIDKYRDIPNPATYYFHTDLEFPFDETLFPVAKRKLLSKFS